MPVIPRKIPKKTDHRFVYFDADMFSSISVYLEDLANPPNLPQATHYLTPFSTRASGECEGGREVGGGVVVGVQSLFPHFVWDLSFLESGEWQRWSGGK